MKSITLKNIDEQLWILVQKSAQQEKSSVSDYLKNIIKKSVSGTNISNTGTCNDFKDLCGVWSDQDRIEFENNVKEFEAITGSIKEETTCNYRYH